MKKLEDIPKRNVFEVPTGYFDQLPLKIQARVEKSTLESSFSIFSLSIRYAIPVILVVIVAAYLLWPKSQDHGDQLASVSTEMLVAFLNESDITTEDLIDEANLNEEEADSLNAVVNLNYTIEGVDLSEMQDVMDNEL